jgi:hypothetical protein
MNTTELIGEQNSVIRHNRKKTTHTHTHTHALSLDELKYPQNIQVWAKLQIK